MDFSSLNIIEPILVALKKKGYKVPTPIQEKTIPLLLEGHDVIGIAQTGTGKTAAFVIPILQKLNNKRAKPTNPRALVLAPTRELAAQISDSFKAYGSNLKLKFLDAYGGVNIEPQIRGLKKGIDILIATPGRLIDLMNQRRVDLGDVEFFVLDEADRMLDMGFMPDVKRIASKLPENRQSLFFSATMSDEISKLTREFLNKPKRVEITPTATPVDNIVQKVFYIDHEDKKELLLDLIKQENMKCVLVFVKAKHRADKVARILNDNGIKTDVLHGNKSQAQRTKALNNFKKGKTRILVATDIAARGLDVENISHVVNFDLPNEPENYIHRIGRTARAGMDGIAYSFCAAEDRNFLKEIERLINKETPIADHKYHSEKAKTAKGKDAKPSSKSGSRGRGGDRGGGKDRRDGNRGGKDRRDGNRGGDRGRFDNRDKNRDRGRKGGRDDDRERDNGSGSFGKNKDKDRNQNNNFERRGRSGHGRDRRNDRGEGRRDFGSGRNERWDKNFRENNFRDNNFRNKNGRRIQMDGESDKGRGYGVKDEGRTYNNNNNNKSDRRFRDDGYKGKERDENKERVEGFKRYEVSRKKREGERKNSGRFSNNRYKNKTFGTKKFGNNNTSKSRFGTKKRTERSRR